MSAAKPTSKTRCPDCGALTLHRESGSCNNCGYKRGAGTHD